ncbi:hypothetical protein [Cytobacillus firmus]|uniref:hypothetical protein n=1 Tax=Cytobacillus firmus TaxID=1399 RepID=UPI0018CCEF48|nr:hypothetical protein [Cytobacillus firmus]
MNYDSRVAGVIRCREIGPKLIAAGNQVCPLTGLFAVEMFAGVQIGKQIND